MDYPTLGTATLGQVDDSYYYAVSCNSCHHQVRLSLLALRAKLGPDYPLVKIRTRLTCTACGSRQIIVSYFTPAHAVTSLGSLFKEPFGRS
jgi:ribosomal protein S27E